MKLTLKVFRNIEALAIIFFCIVIIRAVLTKTTDETEFTINVYFWLSRMLELHACIIAYNCISTRYYKIAIPACAITLMSFINECLHLFNIVNLNNAYLLGFEFILLTILLWVLSRISSI